MMATNRLKSAMEISGLLLKVKVWSHSISVSIMACHAVGTSSILVETAKQCPSGAKYRVDAAVQETVRLRVRIPSGVPSGCIVRNFKL